MSEEEKKEYIEHEIIDRLYCLEEKDFNKDAVTQDYIESVIKAGKEAKELIDKQQKEIEELQNNELNFKTIYIIGVCEGKRYYKDKIREKIKELENGSYDAKIILRKLLLE